MARDTKHNLQPQTDHDGMSRRLAVQAAKTAIRNVLGGKLHGEFGAADSDNIEVLPTYKTWSSLNRAAQDRMWATLAEQIDNDYDRIAKEAGTLLSEGPSVLISADAGKVPDYQTQANIHGQTGGYMLDRGEGDIAAGILYEAGGNIYALGQGIGASDSKAERMIAHIRETYPDFTPKRILEMGCSAGSQTVDYPLSYPEAEVHAIDLSPTMVKYAAARTSALGGKATFHAMDAANTNFPNGYFDLIISHNMFHEVAGTYMQAICDESYRLLADGGICIHQDVPIQVSRMDAFNNQLSAWQKDNNDEPFWLDFAEADMEAMMNKAGFETAKGEYLKAKDAPISWYMVTGVK